MPYLPDFSVLKKCYPPLQDVLSPDVAITVSSDFLRLLFVDLASAQPYNEDFYRKDNPDLRGLADDELRQHFVARGYFEGRRACPEPFEPEFYASQYEDIRRAFGTDDAAKMRDHYMNVGRFEWRSPSKARDAIVGRWAGILMKMKRLALWKAF